VTYTQSDSSAETPGVIPVIQIKNQGGRLAIRSPDDLLQVFGTASGLPSDITDADLRGEGLPPSAMPSNVIFVTQLRSAPVPRRKRVPAASCV
jgi:hypothetical protein